jgi:hypothetical protein
MLKNATENEMKLLAILSAILQMSDHAEKLGGATCIAGVAALNTMQVSIQKNSKKIMAIVAEINRASSDV